MSKSSARVRQLFLSYAPDWIITILLAAAFFSLDKVQGFKRQFSLEDTSLRHTFAVHERIPNFALYLICLVAPLVIQPVLNLITIRSWWDLHNSTLGLILGLSLTGALTQITKITVGRPRPDIIDRCQPIPGSMDPVYGLSSASICAQTNQAIMNDGFRSFFSGHSSLSFAGLGFLSFYLAGKLHLFGRRGHAGKAWLSLTPFAGASLVAISRTMDYRHHWQDVLVGAIVGTTMAYFSYRQYYPSLSSELSHRPYSPRIRRSPELEDVLPTHHHQGSTAGVNPEESASQRRHSYSPLQQSPHPAEYELEQTVQRPDPGPLEEVWKKDVPQSSAPSNSVA